ncbi:MAG: MgtC/SapB family protein [Phycisphaerae bacterium]|nr:MgtC/SapB family protein [Phycisphaerae bacterium]
MNNLMMPLQLLLVVVASFLIGLEMEGRKAGGKTYSPGGVRTFPLISLAGFLLMVLGGGNMAPFVAGLAILGLLLALLYRVKTLNGNYGMTTEAYAVVTYILGALVAAQLWWLVAALTVLMVLLQELKDPLERLVTLLPGHELITVVKFVLLSAVILPLMPAGQYTHYNLQPRMIWLVVVAVTAISYASYLLGRFTRRGRESLLLVGLLGGAYSSTMTTIILSRRSAHAGENTHATATAGAILSASGVMNIRLLILIAIFSPALAREVLAPLLIAAAVGVTVGTLLCLLGGRGRTDSQRTWTPPAPGDASEAAQWMAVQPAGDRPAEQSSPLELRIALGFAAMFVVTLVLTQEVHVRLGERGMFALAGVSGLGIVDPLVLSLTQTARATLASAGLAVMIAAAANHVAKGVYAMVLGERRAARLAMVLLLGLAAVTLAAWWGARWLP